MLCMFSVVLGLVYRLLRLYLKISEAKNKAETEDDKVGQTFGKFQKAHYATINSHYWTNSFPRVVIFSITLLVHFVVCITSCPCKISKIQAIVWLLHSLWVVGQSVHWHRNTQSFISSCGFFANYFH